MPKKCARHPSSRSERKTDSVISSDSDIRFTRRKLGDTQKCGCAVIAGLLIFMLFAAIATYIGCKSIIQFAREKKKPFNILYTTHVGTIICICICCQEQSTFSFKANLVHD